MSKPAPMTAIGAAFGVAVVTALAQLGLASGLAILIWREDTPAAWAAHLAWAAWLAAVSTVIGGMVASRLVTQIGPRVAAVLAAGVGGFVVAPLIALPAARFSGEGIIAAPFIAALIGVVAGMVMAGLALASRAVSVNVAASIALTWVLGGLAVFAPVGELGDEVRLGVWGSWRNLVGALGEGALSVAPPLLIGSLLIGMLTAWLTGNNPDSDSRIAAVSGAAGPLLLIVGYIAAGQSQLGSDAQWSGIWTGVYAVVAGLLGSLLVAALRRRPSPEPSLGQQVADTSPPTAPVTVDDPPLPPVPHAPAHVDPYVSAEYDDEWADPQPGRENEDVYNPPEPPPIPAQTAPDETESWVSDLKDENAFVRDEEAAEPEAAPTKKTKRFSRKKKDKDAS